MKMNRLLKQVNYYWYQPDNDIEDLSLCSAIRSLSVLSGFIWLLRAYDVTCLSTKQKTEEEVI